MEFLKAIVKEQEFWERTVTILALLLAGAVILSLVMERKRIQKENETLRERLREFQGEQVRQALRTGEEYDDEKEITYGS